jgi:signal transduction histidine kinase
MTRWWQLRTHAYLVLSVLLSLIVFLGVYALNEARRHARDADDLLGANFKAVAILKQVENLRTGEMRAAAKFRIAGDSEYQILADRQAQKMNDALIELRDTVQGDDQLTPVVTSMMVSARLERAAGYRSMPAFSRHLHEFERRLDEERTARVDRIRVAAHNLDKWISAAFVIAIAVTSWLAFLLYYALLKPLESIRAAARRIREGELSYRIEKFRGFAELTNLRREFNAMASKLEELDRMKFDFLSTVSHELKTPLTALKEGLAFIGEKQGSLSPVVAARALEVCSQAVKRLETMIQNILNHAKMDSGFYSFDERPKDFIAVLDGAIQGIKPIAERRRIPIELRAPSVQIFASFSTEGITHAIENLVLNAVKYGESARPVVVDVKRVDIRPVPQIEVRVINHGRGILPTELTKVFERFFRGANSDGHSGVGLGLNVVKRIIEAHHGTVEAQSADGITTFLLRIPQRYESVVDSRPNVTTTLEGHA